MTKNLLIKVCGMRQPDNIRAVSQLPIQYMGFIFYPKSSRYVGMTSSETGLLPDIADKKWPPRHNCENKHTSGIASGTVPPDFSARSDTLRLQNTDCLPHS